MSRRGVLWCGCRAPNRTPPHFISCMWCSPVGLIQAATVWRQTNPHVLTHTPLPPPYAIRKQQYPCVNPPPPPPPPPHRHPTYSRPHALPTAGVTTTMLGGCDEEEGTAGSPDDGVARPSVAHAKRKLSAASTPWQGSGVQADDTAACTTVFALTTRWAQQLRTLDPRPSHRPLPPLHPLKLVTHPHPHTLTHTY